jgi:selenocysteine lyase/cysteine desulfurase
MLYCCVMHPVLSATPTAADPAFAELRAREFGRLDRTGLAYLDFVGSGLYAESQIARHRALLDQQVLGNPHSESGPSLASTAAVDAGRARVLRFLQADPAEYVVIFTSNATGAIKLVAESFPFTRGSRYVLAADNHNSVNGVREYALRAGASVTYLPLSDELRLADREPDLPRPARGAASLFAFPAQSNFSGVRHPLALIERAEAKGYDVLLDAAAFLPTAPLSLSAHHPAFVPVSFYKLFGYPTGVGALVVRRDALTRLRRPWFSGGTVDFVSVAHGIHQLRPGAEGYEDGTPNFLDICALEAGFDLLEGVGMARIGQHVSRLGTLLLDGLRDLTHQDGSPLVKIYGPRAFKDRGATIAFNVLDRKGRGVSFAHVIERARQQNVAVRAGCFCNPGASEVAFGFPVERSRHCLEAVSQDFSIERFGDCLGGDIEVGAVRASLGIASNEEDVRRAVGVVGSFADNEV